MHSFWVQPHSVWVQAKKPVLIMNNMFTWHLTSVESVTENTVSPYLYCLFACFGSEAVAKRAYRYLLGRFFSCGRACG
jgi:hypothetical protein